MSGHKPAGYGLASLLPIQKMGPCMGWVKTSPAVGFLVEAQVRREGQRPFLPMAGFPGQRAGG